LERERHQRATARVKAALGAAGLPIMQNDTHIVPVMVGDPQRCKAASDLLLSEYGIYVQPINYPTVARGTERLRITATPFHDEGLIDDLAATLVDVWLRLHLPFKDRVVAADFQGGRVRNSAAGRRQRGARVREIIAAK
jgi:5-aminolevulinate synthase